MRWLEDPVRWPRRKFAGQAIYFFVWFAMTVVGIWLTPNPAGHGTHQSLGLPPCPSMIVFGRPCPGCGLTTSVAATLEGNLDFAWRANPVGVVLYAFFTVTALYAGVRFVQGIRIRSELKQVEWASWAAVGMLILFGAIRFAMTPPVPGVAPADYLSAKP